jgi:hypothetical protein
MDKHQKQRGPNSSGWFSNLAANYLGLKLFSSELLTYADFSGAVIIIHQLL